ncbi:MAG: oligosaccharide flippase family protein [Actinomycetota bacterium]|nr:oligosaccharide flippase family protein [Actinomycetota bacterium]
MKAAMLVDSLWVLGTRFLLRSANFVIFLLLARALTVGEFGFYGYLMSTAVVLSVAFDLGLRQSLAFFTGHAPEERAAVITHMLALWLVLASAAVLTTYGMLVGGGYAESYGALALVAAAGTAPMLFLRTGQGAFLGGGQLGKLNQSELISRVVMLGGTAGLWLLGRLDLAGAVWTLLIAHALAGLYLLFQIRADIAPTTLLDLGLARRMLRHGAVFASGIILMILMGRIGIWLVNALLGEEALGLYFGVQRLGEMLVEVATAVGVVIFSHGVRTADEKEAARDAVRIARIVTACMALLSLATMLWAGPFLTLFLGAPYAVEAHTFRIIMLGTLAACFNVMLFPCLSSQGLARIGIWAYGLGCVVAWFGCQFLIPAWHLLGAALAYALAQAAVAVVIAIAYRARFGFGLPTVLLPQGEDAREILSLARRLPARLRRARG